MSIFARRTQFAGGKKGGSSPGDTQAPTVPSSLAAAVQSDTSIKLTWSASTDNVGVDHYNIYKGGTKIATATVTSYTNSGLTAGTSYSYYVTALDAAGNESAHSNTASATTTSSGGSTSQMYVGAAGGDTTESDWRAMGFDNLEAIVGRMGVRRTYQSSIPTSFSGTYAGADVGKRASWQSIKSPWKEFRTGQHDTELINYLATVPSDHQLFLTYFHEPENDINSTNGTAADFVAATQHFYDVVKANRPSTQVGPILMDWTFDPTSGLSPDDWNPGGSKCDFFGVDTYETYLFPPAGSPKTWITGPTQRQTIYMNWIKTKVGKAPAIGEYASGSYRGSTGTGTDNFQMKVDWISAVTNYFETNGAVMVSYFDTNINNDMSPLSMLEDDNLTTSYWQQLTSTHTMGVK